QHRLGRVIDDQVDPGHRLERTDVAPLPADDAALHLVAGQVQHADDAFGGLLAGHPLDRVDDDMPGPLIGRGPRVVLDVTYQQRRLAFGLRFYGLDQLRLGRPDGPPGDPPQLPMALLLGLGEDPLPVEQRALPVGHLGLGCGDPPVPLGQPLGLRGEQPFALVEASLTPLGVLGLFLGRGRELCDLPLTGAAGGGAWLLPPLLPPPAWPVPPPPPPRPPPAPAPRRPRPRPP